MQSVQKCAKMVCKKMEACHARALRWCVAKGKLLTRHSMIATCLTSHGLRPAVAQRTSGIHGAASTILLGARCRAGTGPFYFITVAATSRLPNRCQHPQGPGCGARMRHLPFELE